MQTASHFYTGGPAISSSAKVGGEGFLQRLFLGFLEQLLKFLSSAESCGEAGRQPVHRFRGGVQPRGCKKDPEMVKSAASIGERFLEKGRTVLCAGGRSDRA